MDNHTIVEYQLQLVAAASIWLAAKVAERNYDIPKIRDLQKSSYRIGSETSDQNMLISVYFQSKSTRTLLSNRWKFIC